MLLVSHAPLNCKPISISVEHCVELTHTSQCEDLFFVKGEHINVSPPYYFNRTDDPGIFTVGSEYGVIETDHFTLFAIVQEIREGVSRIFTRIRNPANPRYKLLMFHKHVPYTPQWTVNFIATKNLSSQIQVKIVLLIMLHDLLILECNCYNDKRRMGKKRRVSFYI